MTTTTMWSGLGDAAVRELLAELLAVDDDVALTAAEDVSSVGWSLLVQPASIARIASAAASRTLLRMIRR